MFALEQSYDSLKATWIDRREGEPWAVPGGTIGRLLAFGDFSVAVDTAVLQFSVPVDSVLKGWQETGKIAADRLATAIPPKEVIDRGIADLKGRMPSEDQDAEVALLRKALDVELETSGFYRKMVSELPAVIT